MKEAEINIAEIEKRLKSVKRKALLIKGIIGFNYSLVAAIGINIIVAMVELFLTGTAIQREAIFYFAILVALLIFLTLVMLPIIRSTLKLKDLEKKELARQVGAYYPEINDELLNALQIAEEKNISGSETLRFAAMKQIFKKVLKFDFSDVFSYGSTKKSFGLSAGAIVTIVVLFGVFPCLRWASYRVANYNEEFTIPQKFSFEVLPGNITITKGKSVNFVISTYGDGPKEIILYTKNTEDTEFTKERLGADSSGIFRKSYSTVNSSVKYFVEAEGISSNKYEIIVIDRPIISSLVLDIIPPRYSGLERTRQKDNGNISVLPGTSLKINITSSKPLLSAKMEFDNGNEKKLVINDEEAKTTFVVFEKGEYFFEITDTDSIENINRIRYSIDLLEDKFPTIELISPKENIKLQNGGKVNLLSKLSDDYGVKMLQLNYKLSASMFEQPWIEFKKKEISIPKNVKDYESFYLWDLSEMILATGDEISYYLEVFDNDNFSGPKSAKSQLLKILVPSIDEVFKEAEEKQESAVDNLKETMKEAEELKKEFQRISDELKKDDKKLSWEEKENIEKATKKFEELQERIEDVQKKEMQKNMQSFKEQMQQLQKNMQMQTQMQTMMEMMRTVNDILRLSKEQEKLKKETQNLSSTSEQLSGNTQKQNELQRKLSRIFQSMGKLSQKSFAITPEMGKAMGNALGEMQQAISAMQNRNSNLAVMRQNGAMKSLNEAANMMKGNMEQMMQNGGQGSGMMSMMQQMQQMSQQQMMLNQMTKQMGQGKLSQEQRAQLQRLAQQQEMIRKSMEELNKESKATGSSKRLAANMEKMLSEMREVIKGMRTEKINDDLIKAQDKILSKMLDAQRSINERDFEKERESQAGKYFEIKSPEEIIFSREGKEKIKDELLKSVKEGYKKDYEEIIRKYFEALQKSKTEE